MFHLCEHIGCGSRSFCRRGRRVSGEHKRGTSGRGLVRDRTVFHIPTHGDPLCLTSSVSVSPQSAIDNSLMGLVRLDLLYTLSVSHFLRGSIGTFPSRRRKVFPQ